MHLFVIVIAVYGGDEALDTSTCTILWPHGGSVDLDEALHSWAISSGCTYVVYKALHIKGIVF